MNSVRTAALMGALFAMVMIVGTAIGGRGGLIMGFGIALVMNGVAYFFSDKLALAAARARPVEPGQFPALEQMVA
ncbi:MAG: protease HtpX, partial [Chloroflexota bacterium]